MFIQREKDITQQEIDEYILLLEKVMTYKTLIQISNDPNTIQAVDKSKLSSCRKDRMKAVQQLEDWSHKLVVRNNAIFLLHFLPPVF